MRIAALLAPGLAAMVLISCAFGQSDEEKDPIDKQVERMLDKDPSTAGTVRAMEEGGKLWDRELNKAYAKLMEALPEADQDALKQAQRSWLAFRDAEKVLSRRVYQHAEGTMYIPMPVGDRLELIKARTRQLRGYLDALESSGGKAE